MVRDVVLRDVKSCYQSLYIAGLAITLSYVTSLKFSMVNKMLVY